MSALTTQLTITSANLIRLRTCVIECIHGLRDKIEATEKRLRYWQEQDPTRQIGAELTVASCIASEQTTLVRLQQRLAEHQALLTELCS